MTTAISEAAFEDSASLGAPDGIAESPWIVMKFGGTSVSTAESWQTIAELVKARLDDGFKPVIVHSALAGVSNALANILEAAVSGDPSDLLEDVREQHLDLAKSLGLDGPVLLDELLHELDRLVAGVRLIKEVSIRVRVRVMALGELMATRLGAASLEHAGLPVSLVDARDLLTSRSRPGRNPATSYMTATCEHTLDSTLQARLEEHGGVILTQGFIARNKSGETVLLGRGGPMCRACLRRTRVSCLLRVCLSPCITTRRRNWLLRAAPYCIRGVFRLHAKTASRYLCGALGTRRLPARLSHR